MYTSFGKIRVRVRGWGERERGKEENKNNLRVIEGEPHKGEV